jgi:hypothetical protein
MHIYVVSFKDHWSSGLKFRVLNSDYPSTLFRVLQLFPASFALNEICLADAWLQQYNRTAQVACLTESA